MPASALSALMGATVEDGMVDVDVEIQPDDFVLTKVRFAGQVTPSDDPTTIRVVTLSKFDEPVTIEAPEITP